MQRGLGIFDIQATVFLFGDVTVIVQWRVRMAQASTPSAAVPRDSSEANGIIGHALQNLEKEPAVLIEVDLPR